MINRRPWYRTADGFIDPFKFRRHQSGERPPADSWAGFLAALTSDEICTLDRLIYEATGGAR